MALEHTPQLDCAKQALELLENGAQVSIVTLLGCAQVVIHPLVADHKAVALVSPDTNESHAPHTEGGLNSLAHEKAARHLSFTKQAASAAPHNSLHGGDREHRVVQAHEAEEAQLPLLRML